MSWQVIYAGIAPVLQKFTPVLMFVGHVCGKAEEAINFYASVFKNAPDGTKGGATMADIVARYGKSEEPDKEGTVRYAHFSLLRSGDWGDGFCARAQICFQRSDILPCALRPAGGIDYLWATLPAGPKAEQCGWFKDKYGVSWQISPAVMQELLGGSDRARVDRVTRTFLKMKKFDIAALNWAAAG